MKVPGSLPDLENLIQRVEKKKEQKQDTLWKMVQVNSFAHWCFRKQWGST